MGAPKSRIWISSDKFAEVKGHMNIATDELRIKPAYLGKDEGIILQVIRDKKVVANVNDPLGFILAERKIPCEQSPTGYNIEQIEGVQFKFNPSDFFQAHVQDLTAREKTGFVRISLTNGLINFAGKGITTASPDAVLYHDPTSPYFAATRGNGVATVKPSALIPA